MDRELRELGVEGELEPGAIVFDAPLQTGADLTTQARTPARLLLRVAEAPVSNTRQLGDLIRAVDWSTHLHRDSEIKVHITTRDSKLRFKDRIQRTVDQSLGAARRKLHRGPRGPGPEQRLHVRVAEDRVRLALDAGGELLHRRGWRLETGKAPLRENLAASLLVAAGWCGDEALVDPFCGVGTIPIEAALLGAGRSPFVGRTMAWTTWPALKDHPHSAPEPHSITQPRLPILGVDKEETAIERACSNARRAHVELDWHTSDVAKLEAPSESGLVVSNPPYGRRLGQSVDGVYRAFGRTLRTRFEGWRAMFLAPNQGLAHKVDRDAERLTTFLHGGSRVGIWVIQP